MSAPTSKSQAEPKKRGRPPKRKEPTTTDAVALDEPPTKRSKMRERLTELAREMRSLRDELQDEESLCTVNGCPYEGVLQCWLECGTWFCPKHFMDPKVTSRHVKSDCPGITHKDGKIEAAMVNPVDKL